MYVYIASIQSQEHPERFRDVFPPSRVLVRKRSFNFLCYQCQVTGKRLVRQYLLFFTLLNFASNKVWLFWCEVRNKGLTDNEVNLLGMFGRSLVACSASRSQTAGHASCGKVSGRPPKCPTYPARTVYPNRRNEVRESASWPLFRPVSARKWPLPRHCVSKKGVALRRSYTKKLPRCKTSFGKVGSVRHLREDCQGLGANLDRLGRVTEMGYIYITENKIKRGK